MGAGRRALAGPPIRLWPRQAPGVRDQVTQLRRPVYFSIPQSFVRSLSKSRNHVLGQVAEWAFGEVRTGHDVDLLDSDLFQLANLRDYFFRCSNQTGRSDRVGCNIAPFFGLDESRVAVMDLTESRVFRQAIAIHALYIVTPDAAEVGRNQGVVFAFLLPDLIQEMQLARYPRTGFVDDPFAGQPLARLEHRGRREEHDVKVGAHLAADSLSAGANMRETGFQIFGGPADRGPSVAIRARGLACLGAVGGDIDRDVIVEIDEVAVTMQELYLAGLAAIGVVDRLAVQEFARHAQIFSEILDPDRILPHHAHRRVAGADSQERSPRGDLVDRTD